MSQKKSENEGEDPIKDAETGERIGGLRSNIMGTALFDGWVMKGRLDRVETMLLNMANGDFKEGTYTYSDDSVEVRTALLEMKRTKTEFVGFTDEGGCLFDLKIQLYAMELDNYSGAEFTASLRSRLSETMNSVIEKCIKANSDALRLGTVISKKFGTVDEWESFDWRSRYGISKINADIEVISVNGLSGEGIK